MKKSMFLKMFGGFGLLILGMSGLIALLSFATIRSHVQDNLAQELEYLGRALSRDVQGFLEQGQTADMDAFLKKEAKDIHARVTVIAPDGTVLADSERDPAGMENHRYRPEVTDALEGRIGKSLRYSVTVEEKMLYVGFRLESDGRVLGVLRLSLFMKTIDVLLGSLRTTIGRSILLMAVAALLLAILLSLNITRPIRKLTAAAREVEAGRFGTRVALRSQDEFRDLGVAFNLMTQRIETLFGDLSRQKEGLANVMASIDEGLLVIDNDGRVVLANERFQKLIGEDAPEGKYYWEVVRMPRIQEFIARLQGERRRLSEEVRADEKTLLCTGGTLDDRGGVVLTMHDVTDLKNIEIVKKDFIVNASHELRTPLAAILGAVETLEEGPGKINAFSLEILKRHAERLRAIVEDLLKLAELEEKGYRLECEDVDPRELARNVVQILTPRLKEKGLEARIDAPEGLPHLKADPFLLEHMLLNLVDNAIKYTEKGDITISLAADARDGILTVRDTGTGIPAEHLPRIFERFYVVDKSRSRKVGGTGLGLSIVKHIVQLHGGSISVTSEVGQGTTFTVRLPLIG
jgi:two-component system phosphate regulon sensor histidine kinase PhoR